jgi:hypothetical protein
MPFLIIPLVFLCFPIWGTFWLIVWIRYWITGKWIQTPGESAMETIRESRRLLGDDMRG